MRTAALFVVVLAPGVIGAFVFVRWETQSSLLDRPWIIDHVPTRSDEERWASYRARMRQRTDRAARTALMIGIPLFAASCVFLLLS